MNKRMNRWIDEEVNNDEISSYRWIHYDRDFVDMDAGSTQTQASLARTLWPPKVFVDHEHTRRYIHTYIPTYLRNYIRTYVRTYLHTYIHTHRYIYIYTHTLHVWTRKRMQNSLDVPTSISVGISYVLSLWELSMWITSLFAEVIPVTCMMGGYQAIILIPIIAIQPEDKIMIRLAQFILTPNLRIIIAIAIPITYLSWCHLPSDQTWQSVEHSAFTFILSHDIPMQSPWSSWEFQDPKMEVYPLNHSPNKIGPHGSGTSNLFRFLKWPLTMIQFQFFFVPLHTHKNTHKTSHYPSLKKKTWWNPIFGIPSFFPQKSPWYPPAKSSSGWWFGCHIWCSHILGF